MGDIANLFEKRSEGYKSLGEVMSIYKDLARDQKQGYLNTPLFERLQDGKNDGSVKRHLSQGFAQMRTWLPQMFGIFTMRYFDHPYAHVVVDNLRDEFGLYAGHKKKKASHAELYRRVLDELNVEVVKGSMSTPLAQASKANGHFHRFFKGYHLQRECRILHWALSCIRGCRHAGFS